MRKIAERYPCTLMLALAVCCLASLAWLLTHDGCLHPIGNTITLVVYVASGTLLLLPRAVEWFDRYLPDMTEGE